MCECEHLSHRRPALQKGKIKASDYKGPREGSLLAADPLKLLVKASAIFQSCSPRESEKPL